LDSRAGWSPVIVVTFARDVLDILDVGAVVPLIQGR
jgi:hypothetical protein